MEAWQGRLVQQIVDQVDAWTTGTVGTAPLLVNTEGLMDAAGLRGTPAWDAFYSLWARVDAENELLTQSWAPPGSGSVDRLREAIDWLRHWALDEAAHVTSSYLVKPPRTTPDRPAG